MRKLLRQFPYMVRQVESLMSADTKLFTRVWSIVWVWVFCCWGWWRSFEVNVTTREPCKLSPIMQSPLRDRNLFRIDDVWARHYGEVVIGCSRSLHKWVLSFDNFSLSRSIINSSYGIVHWMLLLCAVHFMQIASQATFCWSSPCIHCAFCFNKN